MRNFLILLLFACLLGENSSVQSRQLRTDMTASRLARIDLTTPNDAKLIEENGGIIDRIVNRTAEVYLLSDDFETLQAMGLNPVWIRDVKTEFMQDLWERTRHSRNPLDDYHTNDEIQLQFADWRATYPALFRYLSIGNTTDGRPMWVCKVSDNVMTDEAEMEVKYSSTMHGNEPIGTENIMNFVGECLTLYGVDPELTELVNDFEMWFLPLMNPDGNAMGQRWNANGVDLNRDFPDRIDDSVNTVVGRQIETANMMNWSAEHTFVLSANFHCGSLLVNYAFDSNLSGNNVDTPTPEDALFRHISRRYSMYNLPMYNNPEFPPYGISNGADWFVVHGGMQDWNYVWMGDKDVTVELSYTYIPDTTQLEGYWQDNRLSMRYYLLEAKYGVRGTVTDSLTGLPLRANVYLPANPYPTFSSELLGDYFRILQNGTYALTFSAPGYYSKTINNIVVAGGVPTVLNVQLAPQPRAIVSTTPDSLYAELEACDSLDLPLTIENTGQVALNWSAMEQYTNYDGYGSSTGGGWRFLDSDQPGGPVYNWVNIQNRGQAIAFSGDDQNRGPYNIGFSFPFYGQNFTTFRISANGWISFTSSSAGANSYTNVFLPDAGSPENIIAPWWDDLSPQRAGASVRYYTNNLDSLVISYTNVQHYNDGGVYNFECILLGSGNILYQYATMGTVAISSATIGLQNSSRNKGTTVVSNAAYIHNNMAIELCPKSMAEIIPASGVVNAGGSQNVVARIFGCCLPDNLSFGAVGIASNDPITPLYSLPITINVGVFTVDPVDDLVIFDVGGQIELLWSAVPNAVSYNIYRSATFPVDPIPGNLIGNTPSPGFADSPTEPMQFYCVTSVR